MYCFDSKDEVDDQDAAGEQLDGSTDKVAFETTVLARIPDLDAPEPGEGSVVQAVRRDGRLLSQRFSLRLLAGCAVALVLLAVVPYLVSQRKPSNDRYPAPDAEQAPPFVAMSAQMPSAQPAAPSVPSAAPSVQVATPTLSFSAQVPPDAELATQQTAPDPVAGQVPEVPESRQGPAALLARDPGRPIVDPMPGVDGSRGPTPGPARPAATPGVGPGTSAPPWDAAPPMAPWNGQGPQRGADPPAPVLYPSTSPDEPPPRYDGQFEMTSPSPGFSAGTAPHAPYQAMPVGPPAMDTQANRPMSIDPGRQPLVAGHPAPALPAASSWEYYRNQYPVAPTQVAPSQPLPGSGPAGFEGSAARYPVRTTHEPARPGIH